MRNWSAMRPSVLSYAFLGSFVLTVFMLQWWQQSTYPELWILLVSLGLVSLVFANHNQSLIIVLLGIAIGTWVVSNTTHVPNQNSIDSYADGRTVVIEGTIVAEPDRRPLKTKYTIAAESLTQSGFTRSVEGKVLINSRSQWPQFAYGDRVQVRGKLDRPGLIDETFHYDRYLSRYGIYSVIYRASVKKTKKPEIKKPNVLSKIFQLKARFESQTNRLYPEPHASFMAGLLTGSRRGIPEHLMADFNTTGLTHIIAISGYNITIIIVLISGALFWLPLRWRLIPAITAIVVFTIFVGASAAVVRAAIMGCLGLLALHCGRQTSIRLSILWTLFFMLSVNPKLLWYDVGFQLSFLAVLGLVELSPLLDYWFRWCPQTLGMREALQMTCAAQLSAVPFILYIFGRLSLIAPFANVVVAPFVPLAMLFGFLGTVVSFICFPLGLLLAYLGWSCLEWIIIWTKWLANVPYASVDVGMSVGILATYYGLMISILWMKQRT